MERREGNQPQYIQIEGPVTLEAGQNFYDQPPFNVILPKVAKRHGVDQTILQTGLTQIGKQLARALPEEKKKIAASFRMDGTLGGVQGTRPAVIETVKAMDVFPQWDSYVSEEMMKNMYKKDGTFSRQSQSKDESKTPSYGAWYEKKMARNARFQSAAVRSVLIDTFPQDLQQRSVHDAIASTGVKPPRKRWQILKASPTIPKK